MAEKTLNTIIVLRNDKSTDWANSDVILKEGEVGVSYLDNGNVVVKAGDGVNKWPDLKQVEGVFEQPVTLTQNFGYYNDVPTGGYKTYSDTAGMTTSEFLLSALKKTVEPTIVQPSCSLSASAVIENNDKEIGAKITGITWDGSTYNGSYKVGSGSDQGTGISSSNFTWAVSNNIDAQTSTSIDGTFTLTSDDYIQINSESEANYATVSATVTLNADGAKTPKNNLGEDTTGKITTTSAGSPWSKSASVKVTGYRKPFWAVLTTPYAETKNDAGTVTAIALTSANVRGFSGKGTKVDGFPTTLNVPEGSRQVIFAAKAGTYKGLTAKDGNAQDATVTFSKIANAVSVEGANSYTATAYDVFEVTWGDPIASAKALKLTWSK